MKVDGRIVIAASGILYGGVTIDASLLARGGLSTLDISFFFLLISIIPLAPFVARRGIFQKMISSFRFLTAYALVNTFILLSQFGSISLGLSPAIVALLLYTQPVWTVIFARTFFKERINSLKIAVILVALLGIILITEPFSMSSQNAFGSSTLSAELLALLGGVFLSLWIILGKKGRLERFKDPAELTFAVRTASFVPIGTISLVALIFGGGLFLGNLESISSNIWLLLVFAIFAGAVPDFLFYTGVENVGSLQAGVLLLLEPLSTSVVSVILKISTLSVLQILGGALILTSNYLVLRDSNSPPENQSREARK